jgi:hypothetical protein
MSWLVELKTEGRLAGAIFATVVYSFLRVGGEGEEIDKVKKGRKKFGVYDFFLSFSPILFLFLR